MWGSSDVNTRGEALLEYLAGTHLEVLNRGNEPTFVNRIRREVIDLTLATRNISTLVSDWRVSGDILLSDHRMIRLNIGADAKVKNTPRRNPRLTDWESYLTGLQAQTRDESQITTQEDLDQHIEEVNKRIVNAFEAACPLNPFPFEESEVVE